MYPADILPSYEREADFWARTRDRSLWERPILEAALAGKTSAQVLDLGCGTGQPIARWFADHGAAVTGVDGAAAMIAHFRAEIPQARAMCADMRGLSLGQRFDVILAFDSFFHLTPDAQRAMFPVFAAHAAPKARLVLTTGPQAGDGIMGRVGDSRLYHASLDPDDYRACLRAVGFQPRWFRSADTAYLGRSVWLADFTAG